MVKQKNQSRTTNSTGPSIPKPKPVSKTEMAKQFARNIPKPQPKKIPVF